ncbi:MAG: transcription termination/antitermination factor NusG [Candidatus Margulisiibacteriota bacterium]|nr:MAG: transcription termination/antitermination factor NusG [Candidatus Margulisiibacteriota bacterium]HAR62720.1 transcription termination/antitermination factor NusG [Candidatus Margulisiibacteriota bacterium]HCT85185.1 transcription termination/antitermination factor NusG [Candidatus Margulisiibacteriota bacterium]HCY36785.1 transcription termination/antitermination factor NusG [Candidatus Margulisiibacteriota bacterium]
MSEETINSGEEKANQPNPQTEEINRDKGQWFILQTYSGHEKKVKQSLLQKIIKLELQDRIHEVLIPEEETIEIKDNKRVEKIKKMFPGYIFIRMDLDDEVWYHVKVIPGVSKFISSKTRPTPVTDKEMLRVLKQVGVKTPKIEVDFEIGEVVKIIAGPFRGYSGPIQEITPERGKLKSLIAIFGRETPVELDFEQVEKQR